MAPRGRGGKFSKPTRGGGKHFSRDLQPLDKDGNPIGMWRDPADKKNETSSEEDSSEEEEEEEDDSSDDDDAAANPASGAVAQTREQRKEEQRKKKLAAIARKNKKVAEVGDMPSSDEESSEEEDADMPANPNHTTKSRAQARIATGPSGETPLPSKKGKDSAGDTANLSRREREAIETQAARERYQKLHAEGKTDEARADLERLSLIRKERAAAAARKAAENEARDAEKREREDEIKAREDKLRAAAMGGTGAVKGGGRKKGNKK